MSPASGVPFFMRSLPWVETRGVIGSADFGTLRLAEVDVRVLFQLALAQLLQIALAREAPDCRVRANRERPIFDFQLDFLSLRQRQPGGEAGGNTHRKAVSPTLQGLYRHFVLVLNQPSGQ